MKIKNYYVSLCYDIYFSYPIITDEAPKDRNYIELTVINTSTDNIARKLDGKYVITDSNICFYDTKELIKDISVGEVHLVLTTTHDLNDDEDCIPKTEIIHAEIVDDEQSSEFQAFAYNYKGKPRVDISENPYIDLYDAAIEKANEVNAPCVIGIESCSFVCEKIEINKGNICFNEEYHAETAQSKSSTYDVVSGSIVQLNNISEYCDFYDGYFATTGTITSDIMNIGEYTSLAAVS